MQVIFTKIRQGNIEEVKRILGKHPEAVNSVSGLKPKKDHGQSALQVALKTGHTEIADYLIEHGADLNFMEAEDDDPGPRMPVLFDAIIGVIASLCYKEFDVSDESLVLTRKMLERGSDVNAIASYGADAMTCVIHEANQIVSRPTVYSEVQDEAWIKLEKVLDLLLEYGFDYNAWLDRSLYPDGTANRKLLLERDIDVNENWLKQWQSMRDFIQGYFEKKELLKK
jgi:hypothetical protein